MTDLPQKIRKRAWVLGGLWVITLLLGVMFAVLYFAVSPAMAAPLAGTVVLLGMAIYETVRLRRDIRDIRDWRKTL